MTNINSVISKYDKSIEKTVPSYSGILGLTINGEEAVNIATRPGFVYVRLRDNTSEVISAFNDKVSPVYNLPVLVERKGNRWYITGRDDQRYSSWGSSSSFLPAHGDQHSFNRDGGGGGDVVGVYPDQFMPLLVQPSGAYGAGTLLVNPYVLQRDTDFIYVGNTGTRNLLPYKPTNNQAIMGLVYLDTTTGNPGVLIASGTPLAATITGTAQVIPYLPYPASNQEPLYAFRLVSGTSALTWDNLYNVRQFVGGGNGTASTGTSGVSAHNDLTGIQGGGTGSYFHLNGTQINGLVSGSVTTLHSHALTGTVSAHNNLTGIQGGGTGAYFHLNSPQTLGLVSGSVTTLHNHSGSAIPFNFVTGSIAFAGADGNLDEDNKRLRYNSTLRSVRMGKDIPLNNFADIFPFFATQELPNESIIMGVYAYGSGTSGAPLPGFGMYRSRGTPELPTPVKSGDILGSIFGTGYDGSDFFNGGRIRFYADADWVTGTYRPSRMTFQVTPSGSATQVEKMFLYGDSLNLVNTGTYNVNGVPILETFLATANTFTAAQTIAPPSPTDGTDLLKFTTERAWTLQQASTGGTSMLEFFSDTAGKYVRINPNSVNTGGLIVADTMPTGTKERFMVEGTGNIKGQVSTLSSTGYAFQRLKNDTGQTFDFGQNGSARTGTVFGINNSTGGVGLAFAAPSSSPLAIGTLGAFDLYLATNGTVRAQIDSSGNIYLGGSTTNAVKIETNGEMSFIGTATVWDDLRVSPDVKGTGAKDPSWVAWLGTVNLYDFDNAAAGSEKELWFNVQMPHGWKEGSSVYPHVHWTNKTAGTAGHVVRWGLEYTVSKIGGTFPATATVYGTTIVGGGDITVANEHMITSFDAITMTGNTISTILSCRLFRNSSNAADTYTGTAGLLSIDWHFEVDKVGSRTEFA